MTTKRPFYIVKVPPTNEMGSFSTVAQEGYGETVAQNALWAYNDARKHEGLKKVKRMPAGTTYKEHNK